MYQLLTGIIAHCPSYDKIHDMIRIKRLEFICLMPFAERFSSLFLLYGAVHDNAAAFVPAVLFI